MTTLTKTKIHMGNPGFPIGENIEYHKLKTRTHE